MTPRQLAQRARAALREAGDPRVARSQKRFFKRWERISFYGLKTPDVKRIERELYAGVRKSWTFTDALLFCDLLMRDSHLESKAVGLLLLERYHRQFEEELIGTAAGLAGKWVMRQLGRHGRSFHRSLVALDGTIREPRRPV